MKFAQMRKFDTANGTGVRATLFFSGCSHDCKGCFNRDYQNFEYGEDWTQEEEDKFIEYIKDENVVGASILGGEPFQKSSYTLYKLFRRIKEDTGKSIWVWTGYRLDELEKHYHPALAYVDVLVDGRFIEEEKDLSLKFRGSRNQRVIDMQATINNDFKPILYME